MSLQNYIKFEPVRFSAAVGALGAALTAVLAIVSTAGLAAALGAVWAAGLGVFNALFVRNAVTANPNVIQLAHDTIVALAPLAPKSVAPDPDLDW